MNKHLVRVSEISFKLLFPKYVGDINRDVIPKNDNSQASEVSGFRNIFYTITNGKAKLFLRNIGCI